MTIEEIRKGAPNWSTHYYYDRSTKCYLFIRNGGHLLDRWYVFKSGTWADYPKYLIQYLKPLN